MTLENIPVCQFYQHIGLSTVEWAIFSESAISGPPQPIWDYGITGENLGLQDYTLFEIWITEISFEIGIMDIKSNQKGIFHPCTYIVKLGLRDYTLFVIGITGLHYSSFEIRITGLQDPPYGCPNILITMFPNTNWAFYTECSIHV